MTSELLVPFTTPEPDVEAMGGKAASLVRLTGAGFNVPAGVVLTTAFFEPWCESLVSTGEWQRLQRALERLDGEPTREQRSNLDAACGNLGRAAEALALSAAQQEQVERARTAIGASRYAVRSSSPQEDLSGSSFAGQYETILNVDPASLEAAVRQCFCSCLDARVFQYKRSMGFDYAPSIAVVIQAMVDSEVSGVAFSINPLTNDFDEVLINSSWGLGEALVSGDITPDSIVADKHTRAVVSYTTGDKGGDRPQERSLAGARTRELLDIVVSIEHFCEQPMDVEWAYADGHLHVLQARPVTAYVPLHASLLTAPGQPRRLYVDGYLTDGITMSAATTPMSDNVFELLTRLLFEYIIGTPALEQDFKRYGIHNDVGRLYLDLSMYLHLLGKGDRLAKKYEQMSPMMAALITSPALERYRPARPEKHVRRSRFVFRHLPAMLWRTRRAAFVLFGPVFRPRAFDARYRQALAEFDNWIRRPVDFSQSVHDCLIESLREAGKVTLTASYPAFMYYYLYSAWMRALVDQKSAEQVALVDAILGGHEDDMVLQMGVAIFNLARLLPASDFEDLETLEEKLRRRELPAPFLSAWNEFVERFGARGPLEMELANPGYGEAPTLAFEQMAMLAGSGDAYDPNVMQHEQVERRERAYERLMEILPARKRRRLRKCYETFRYASARELFKHHIMQIYERVRRLLLNRADQFVREGRLDDLEQIFEVKVAHVDRAARDSSFDLRAAAMETGAFSRKLRSQVRHFPMAIDSRGRILRPPVIFDDGALVGAAVSAGVARGPVKVLNDPFEKEILPGDVLVAVTTDPGWTPLFINAAAIILEIGGPLQHGALVAREYGKPCVSGIPDITAVFRDGQLVEVDGDRGLVRVLESSGG